MSDPSGTIHAPWTTHQVEQLNRFQQCGLFHPFTCGNRDKIWHEADPLVATAEGWRCTFDGCGYHQTWAHASMANETFLDEGLDVNDFVYHYFEWKQRMASALTISMPWSGGAR